MTSCLTSAPTLASRSGKVLRFTLLLALLSSAGRSGAGELPPFQNFMVDQTLQPSPQSLAAFDLCILHPHAEVDMEPGHAQGNQFYALLDSVHVRTGSREAMMVADRNVASRPSTSNKRIRIVDPTDAQWIPWVVEALADPVAKKGFDGFVLSFGDEASTPATRTALVALAATLHQRYPDKKILLDLHSQVSTEAFHVTDGFLAMGVFTHEDKNGSVDLRLSADLQRDLRQIHRLQLQGVHVLVVDFAPANDRSASRDVVERIRSIGALPFVTTPALSGINLGPMEEVSRRVLVLHGWDKRHVGADAPEFASTSSAHLLQKPLEWLGCKVEHRVADGADFLDGTDGLSAVILDSSLVLSGEQQTALAAWLPSLRARKIPLLLTGMPWTDASARKSAMAHLDLGGSAQAATRLVKTNIARMDNALLRTNERVSAHSIGFLDLEAPADARVILALRGQDALGAEHRFDQAFLASWGGAWIEPAADAAGAQVDLAAFLSQWLGSDAAAPVPDTTTREGRRVFFSAIDSTGFAEPSTLPGFPLCSEVMRDRILDRFFLPVTVSVCEAEMRGWLPGQKAEEAPRLEHVARSIFEMPQIQVASNSFSRPEAWTAGMNISRELNERALPGRHDMEREIAGSMIYIHRRLLPLSKDVNLMLWPPNAAPTAEALRFCQSMSMECLPAAPVATVPSAVEEGDTVRMEPLAVRCRFSDVRTEEGVSALEKTFNACAAEPLHAVTASAYVASLKDAGRTRILRASEGRWIILNEGACRTVRLPQTAGLPDMEQCDGVSGYTVHAGQVYIHTMGRARTDLVMTKSEPRQHIHLAQSSATVEFMELSSRRATFQVRDLRPVEVVLGGFEPRGLCAYLENGRPYTATADADGLVSLELSCRSTVSLQSLPPATHAAMR